MLLLLLGMLLIALNQSRNEEFLEKRSLARIEREAWATGTRLAGMMQHLFRKEQDRAAELEMSYASVSHDLDLGFVCDSDNLVRFGTQLQWRGLKLQDTPLANERGLVERARKKMDGLLEWSQDGRWLKAVFPFFSRYDPNYRGVVLLSYDSNSAVLRARADAKHESIVQACVLSSACLLLWLALDLLVARRVQMVLDYAKAVKEGLNPLPMPKGEDELSMIAAGFEEAVRKVHETESRLMESAEAERRRIGRDIHDDVCQRIAAAQLKGGILSSALTKESSAFATLAEDLAAELRETASVTRIFARGLAPVWVEREGLAPAIDELATQLARSYAIQCRSELDLGMKPLAVWVQTHVFRILQELATNAAKHASPSWITMRVKVGAELLRIEVESDGEPFRHSVPRAGGLGIMFLKQRVRALGGRLSFQTRGDGFGTLALCEAALGAIHFFDESGHP